MIATPRSIAAEYQGASWPPVTACSTPACPMRAPTVVVGPSWTCADHTDEWAQQAVHLVGQALAAHAVDELRAAPDRPVTDPITATTTALTEGAASAA